MKSVITEGCIVIMAFNFRDEICKKFSNLIVKLFSNGKLNFTEFFVLKNFIKFLNETFWKVKHKRVFLELELPNTTCKNSKKCSKNKFN